MKKIKGVISNTLNVAAAGVGVNTFAYLIECTKRGIVFEKILFADPGSEYKETYDSIPVLNEWLINNGQPEVTIVRQLNKNGEFIGLYQDCYNINSLPSIIFGRKSCSAKFKISPQEKYLNNYEPAQYVWSTGTQVNLFIGYDADESHRTSKDYSNDKYNLIYPLVDLDMGRFECISSIRESGLTVPKKSSCTFCPSHKPWEVVELYKNDRPEFYRCIDLERNSKERMTNIKGLGRDWSWWELIVAYRILNFIKRSNKANVRIDENTKKLIRKINNSKPKDFEKISINRSVKENINYLFRQSIEISCDCI